MATTSGNLAANACPIRGSLDMNNVRGRQVGRRVALGSDTPFADRVSTAGPVSTEDRDGILAIHLRLDAYFDAPMRHIRELW